MTIDQQKINDAVAANLPRTEKFLCDLVATPSLPGQESAAMELVAQAFAQIADVTALPLSNDLRKDRDYCDPISDIDYQGRSNLRAVVAGAGGGKNLLLNTHIDTVPPSQGQDRPFEPQIIDGAITGRGSCDAKGQAATIFLTMAAIADLGVKLSGDLIGHLVVEEEVGGNGTLAMVRRGENADGCVVLEPTELRLLTSIRGAVWFRVTLTGKPGHSGEAGKTRSALKMASRVIEILENYHAALLTESLSDPACEIFKDYPNPMPLTIGKLHAGNWAATSPGEAVLEGVLGLLPNKTADQVMAEIRTAISTEGGADIMDNFDIHFMYRHDCSVCPTDHELVKQFSLAAQASNLQVKIDAMTASCDAWFYNNQLDIPTVVFGGGSLSVAHSNNERMPIADLQSAAKTLVNLAVQWCGVHQT